MARTKSKTLTDGELRIMNVLWKLKEASVKEVVARLESETNPAYNTVQTMMGILAEKGYLGRRKVGRAYVYAPTVTRAAARAEALQHMVGSFFGGSRSELLHNLLDEEALDVGELDEMRQLLASSKAKRKT